MMHMDGGDTDEVPISLSMFQDGEISSGRVVNASLDKEGSELDFNDFTSGGDADEKWYLLVFENGVGDFPCGTLVTSAVFFSLILNTQLMATETERSERGEPIVHFLVAKERDIIAFRLQSQAVKYMDVVSQVSPSLLPQSGRHHASSGVRRGRDETCLGRWSYEQTIWCGMAGWKLRFVVRMPHRKTQKTLQWEAFVPQAHFQFDTASMDRMPDSLNGGDDHTDPSAFFFTTATTIGGTNGVSTSSCGTLGVRLLRGELGVGVLGSDGGGGFSSQTECFTLEGFENCRRARHMHMVECGSSDGMMMDLGSEVDDDMMNWTTIKIREHRHGGGHDNARRRFVVEGRSRSTNGRRSSAWVKQLSPVSYHLRDVSIKDLRFQRDCVRHRCKLNCELRNGPMAIRMDWWDDRVWIFLQPSSSPDAQPSPRSGICVFRNQETGSTDIFVGQGDRRHHTVLGPGQLSTVFDPSSGFVEAPSSSMPSRSTSPDPLSLNGFSSPMVSSPSGGMTEEEIRRSEMRDDMWRETTRAATASVIIPPSWEVGNGTDVHQSDDEESISLLMIGGDTPDVLPKSSDIRVLRMKKNIAAMKAFIDSARRKFSGYEAASSLLSLPLDEMIFLWDEQCDGIVCCFSRNVECVLGRGPHGEVFFGVTEHSTCAVKVLAPRKVGYRIFDANEISAMMRVHSTGLVQLYHCEGPFVVLEYCAHSLDDPNWKRHVNMRTLVMQFRALLQALDEMHSLGIPHGAIGSRRNILVHSGMLKLSAFVHARRGGKRRNKWIPQWMAKDCLDIGWLLVYLFAGKPEFEREEEVETSGSGGGASDDAGNDIGGDCDAGGVGDDKGSSSLHRSGSQMALDDGSVAPLSGCGEVIGRDTAEDIDETGESDSEIMDAVTDGNVPDEELDELWKEDDKINVKELWTSQRLRCDAVMRWLRQPETELIHRMDGHQKALHRKLMIDLFQKLTDEPLAGERGVLQVALKHPFFFSAAESWDFLSTCDRLCKENTLFSSYFEKPSLLEPEHLSSLHQDVVTPFNLRSVLHLLTTKFLSFEEFCEDYPSLVRPDSSHWPRAVSMYDVVSRLGDGVVFLECWRRGENVWDEIRGHRMMVSSHSGDPNTLQIISEMSKFYMA
jgi:hypothetical protein